MVAYNYKIAHGFRSGLEERVCEQLAFLNILDCYEIKKISFVQPEKNRNYTPDFWLPNNIIVETKGVFTVQDRQKHLWIKEQYTDLDLRFVFSNSKNKLRKVMFKQNCGLTKEEKLKIVGTLIGRSKKVHADDIYECMLDLNDMGKKITINRIAGLLDCSSRTIHRNMCEELRQEKQVLNELNTKE